MSNEQSYRAPRRRGPRGPMGGGMMPDEKAKDLAGRFIKNFAKFEGNAAGKALVAAGPKL